MTNYSDLLRQEILSLLPKRICCRHSFLAGYLSGGRKSENSKVAYSIQPLFLEDISEIVSSVFKNNNSYNIQNNKLVVSKSEIIDFKYKFVERMKKVIFGRKANHCLIAFMQGIFFSSGYIQNPEMAYHLEIRVRKKWVWAAIRIISKHLKIRFRFYARKKYRIAYIKNIDEIIKFARKLKLFNTLIELTDYSATKNLLGLINRQVNFESANINRTISASERAIENIDALLKHSNQDIWSDILRNTAKMRVKFPHDSIEQLGKRFTPEISKSAINHRLRRINALYQKVFGKAKNT